MTGKLHRGVFLAAAMFFLFSVAIQAARASDGILSPPPGSPLRKAILKALRQEVKTNLGMEVVFVVQAMNVKNGWAWVHTRPCSPDGANRYEDLSALLQLRKGAWAVVEIPCTEPENPECLDDPAYFDRLQNRFPGVPSGILPR